MNEQQRKDLERKADLALFLSAYAVALASYRPKKKSIGDRLWDLI
jgi:hypothetical protein